MKYIGKGFEYFTHCGIKRVGTVKKIEFHKELGKPIFIGVSPLGTHCGYLEKKSVDLLIYRLI